MHKYTGPAIAGFMAIATVAKLLIGETVMDSSTTFLLFLSLLVSTSIGIYCYFLEGKVDSQASDLDAAKKKADAIQTAANKELLKHGLIVNHNPSAPGGAYAAVERVAHER